MAIAFARCELIRRSVGNSGPRVAAYNARTVVINERTGERHDATRWANDLLHHEIRLPAGASRVFADTSVLANAAEAAERRHDSRIGREFVLALPKELAFSDRLSLARSFVDEHFVSKGLPVQLDIHGDHAHFWTPMRRLEGDRFATTHATDLLGAVRTSRYGVFVTDAERWGRTWAVHQSRFFQDHNLDLRVDPTAIIPETRSYGPKRSWGPDPEHSRVAELIAKHRAVAAERARDAMAVFEHLRRQPTGFNIRDLSAFVAKHVVDPNERAAVYAKAEDAWFNQIVRDLWADRGTIRHASGIRHLLVEDIARRMSPQLAALEAEARKLQKQQRKAAYGMEKRQHDFSEANRRIETIGMLRKVWHHVVREDTELHMLYGWRRGQNAAFTHLATREKHAADRLEPLTQAIAAEWASVGPAAETELRSLQKRSADAQRELDKLRVDVHSGQTKLAILATISEKEIAQMASADQLHELVNQRLAAHDQKLDADIVQLRQQTSQAQRASMKSG